MTRNSRWAVVAAVLGSALAVPAQAVAGYADSVLADAPLMYLRLGEAPGATVAQDASPNDRDGTYVGAPSLGVAGPFTQAGTAAGLAAGSSIAASVPPTSGAVELWVNPNRLANGQQAGLISHGDPAGNGWALGIGTRRKLVWIGGGSAVSSKVTLSAGVWTQLTVAWTSNKVHIYRNGGLVKSLTRPGATPVVSSGAVVVGGTGAGAFTGAYAGRMDEVALYAQTITATDAQEHFLAASVPVNTVAPSIDGSPTVGTTLTAQPGAWADGSGATYQWQRCDADGEDCDDVVGATGATYVVTAADACRTLQVAVTVSNPSGAATAISGSTTAVPGTCPDPGPGGDPDPTPTPTPTPTPAPTSTTPTTTTPTTTPGGGSSGSAPTATAAGCLKLLPGRRSRKVRRLGRLRLAATAGRCVTSPLTATFKARKGRKLRSVRYKLDGKRLKRSKRSAKLQPSALRTGTHKLSVVVKPRTGRARRATLKLRVVLG